MKTFKVYVTFRGQGVYKVKAKNKKEAEETFSSDNFDYQDLPAYCTDEQVFRIVEAK